MPPCPSVSVPVCTFVVPALFSATAFRLAVPVPTLRVMTPFAKLLRVVMPTKVFQTLLARRSISPALLTVLLPPLLKIAPSLQISVPPLLMSRLRLAMNLLPVPLMSSTAPLASVRLPVPASAPPVQVLPVPLRVKVPLPSSVPPLKVKLPLLTLLLLKLIAPLLMLRLVVLIFPSPAA